jgi:hypothetical protein
MRRLQRLLAVLAPLAAILVMTASASASVGHCGDDAAGIRKGHEHGAEARVTAALHTAEDEDCSRCPAGTCGALHGCSVVGTVASQPAATAIHVLQPSRAMTALRHEARRSFVAAPPTPPPNRLLSIQA